MQKLEDPELSSTAAVPTYAPMVLIVPILVFFILSGTLDLGALLRTYRDYDYTPYLAARSLARDLDLACNVVDSDRFFRETESRPSSFRVADRRVLFSSGDYRTYPVFYYPDLFVYVLLPFAGLLGFHGWMLLHALLIGAVLWMGYSYYRKPEDRDTTLSAINSVVYYAMALLPVLFLLPTHHLYLFALVTAAVFFGLKGWPVVSAAIFGLAFSTQPWAVLPAVLLVGFWQFSGMRSEAVRFVPALIASVAVAMGLEFLMYPHPDISAVRWIQEPVDATLAALHRGIPVTTSAVFAAPSWRRVADFLFGRTIGFFIYGIAGACILFASLWYLKDRLINRTLVYILLLLIVVSATNPQQWGIYGFISDFGILMSAVLYFCAPITKPKSTFVISALLAGLLAGPLLINPLGAWTSREYYRQSFPYRWFPAELSLVNRAGITADPDYQLAFAGGKLYFLNDEFYPEADFFWVHGEAVLEFLMEFSGGNEGMPVLRIVNGSEDNKVIVELGNQRHEFFLQPSGGTTLDLQQHGQDAVQFEGRRFLHGTIKSSSGFVPRLLSRENPDFRFLGCQVRITGNLPGQ